MTLRAKDAAVILLGYSLECPRCGGDGWFMSRHKPKGRWYYKLRPKRCYRCGPARQLLKQLAGSEPRPPQHVSVGHRDTDWVAEAAVR